MNLRGGLVGCGYFAQNHLNAWREVRGAEIVAVCDMDAERAQRCADDFAVAAVYRDVGPMLAAADLDFVDIVTQPASHRALVEQVAAHGTPLICQRTLAPSLDDGRGLRERGGVLYGARGFSLADADARVKRGGDSGQRCGDPTALERLPARKQSARNRRSRQPKDAGASFGAYDSAARGAPYITKIK